MPEAIFLPLSLICAGVVVYRYVRIRRTSAGIGWALFILAIGGFGSGLAGSFAWSGFLFLFIAAAGLMIVAQDYVFRRHARRKRQQDRQYDLNHRI
jgi:membrane protein implicated in regulation of membrane protease activity